MLGFRRNKIYWRKTMWTWLLPTDLKQLQNSGSVNVSFPLEHVLKNCFMQGSASYRSASSVSSTKPSALWSNNCLNTVRIGSRQPCFFEPKTTKFSCNKFRLCSHPNLARILPILLEHLESRSICNQDRKIPILTSDIFKWILMILIHQTEYQSTLAENDYPENLKDPHKI